VGGLLLLLAALVALFHPLPSVPEGGGST
jgi:hypothetical protein